MYYCMSLKNSWYASTRNGAQYNSTCIPAYCYLHGLPLLVSRMVGSQVSSYSSIIMFYLPDYFIYSQV